MLIILVFLILAVLLLGSSAILGALGMIAGFIALTIALFLAIAAFDTYPIAFLLVIAVIGVAVAGLFIADRRSDKKITEEKEKRDAPITHQFERVEHKKMRDKMEPYLLQCLAVQPDSEDIKGKLADLRRRYPLPSETEWRRLYGE